MVVSNDWLSAAETMNHLRANDLQGRELVKVIARQCAWNDLRTTGFRQITMGDDHASGDVRNSYGIGHLWRYFTAAFWDVSGLFSGRSTLLEEDWEHTSFRYRIERDAGDDRLPCEIDCWFKWSKGCASYSILNEDGSIQMQEVWRSLQFDRLGVEALARQWKKDGARNMLTFDETAHWLATFTPRNTKTAWPKYRDEFGLRGVAKAAFEAAAKEVWGFQPVGRPRAISS